jgi:hypothetical protein
MSNPQAASTASADCSCQGTGGAGFTPDSGRAPPAATYISVENMM